MVKKSYLFILFFFLVGITTYAQKVSNISYRQEQSTIVVSYDLETKTPCKIDLYVSTDGGKTWKGPLKKVTGDAGTKISTGSNSIIWNVLEEYKELRGNNIKFQVRAKIIYIETVKIGYQEWTKKNLNVSKYRNGDIIPEVKDPKKWENLTTGAWCYYNNDPKKGAIYGKLYNWYAVNDPRGLAPEGFHVPTEAELNMVPNLKNPTGFAGLPGGFRIYDGTFISGIENYWWCSSVVSGNTDSAWNRNLNDDSSNSDPDYGSKTNGFSVRCIKD
jgi:hypothetical protein